MLIVSFDTVEPYISEAIPILFYPNGFIYENRYKARFVEGGVVNLPQQEGGRLNKLIPDEEILLCIRSKSASGLDEYNSFEYENGKYLPLLTPIRFAKVANMQIISGVVLIQYVLGDLFYYNGDTYEDVKNSRLHFNRSIYAQSAASVHHVFRTPLVFNEYRSSSQNYLESGSSDFHGSRTIAWKNIVSLCAALPHLKSRSFLLFQGFREVIPKKRRSNYKVISSFRDCLPLNSGKTYTLRLFECFPDELVPKEIQRAIWQGNAPDHQQRSYELSLDDNFFAVKRSQRTIGGYDFIEYNIPVRGHTHGNSGAFYLKTDGGDEPATRLYLTYNIAPGMSIWKLLFWISILIFQSVYSGLKLEIAVSNFIVRHADYLLAHQTLQTWAPVMAAGLDRVLLIAGLFGVLKFALEKFK